MSSTVVHVALGGILAAALLGSHFDRRTLAVVLAAAAFPDLDTFLGIWIHGGHRALFHTLLLPAALAALVAYDLWWREASWLGARWGIRGQRTAVAGVAAMAFAGVGLDMFTNGVNVLYPVHDQFYKLNGEILLSNHRGVVQTFVELQPPTPESTGGNSKSVAGTAVGSTETKHYSTGVDVEAGADPANVERVFPVVRSGWQLLLVLTSLFVMGARAVENRLGGGRA